MLRFGSRRGLASFAAATAMLVALPGAAGAAPASPNENCPETAWTLPIQVKGVACLLLLPKPEQDMAAA